MTDPDEIKKEIQLPQAPMLDDYRESFSIRDFFLRHVGRRGSALLFFAFLDFVYSFSLWAPPVDAKKTASLKFIASVLPLPVWATLWAIAAVLCLIDAFRKKDKIGFAAAITIKVLWGWLFIIGGVAAHLERAYVSATVWLCLAAWVAIISGWPEPPIQRKRAHGDEVE